MKKVFWLTGLTALVAALAVVGCEDDKGGGGGGDDDEDGSGGAGPGSGGAGPVGSTGSGVTSTGSSMTTTSTGPGPGSGGSGGTGGSGGSSGGCNPVTNAPCDTAAGEACDASQDSGFVCFPPPNDVALCGQCNNSSGPFCQPGATCQGNMGTTCVRYCCTDADCGGATCQVGVFADLGQPDLGICDAMACEVPASPPSNGSCVK